jgi:hypothetical protein
MAGEGESCSRLRARGHRGLPGARRVETIWWRECEADPTVFVRVIGRIRWQADKRGEAPFVSAIIVFGKLPGPHGRYPAECANPACPRPYRRFWPTPVRRPDLFPGVPPGTVPGDTKRR